MLNAETGAEGELNGELETILAQTINSADLAGVAQPEGYKAVTLDTVAPLDPAAVFDFSWLDALGSGIPDAGIGAIGAVGGGSDAEGEQDLAQILAAFGTG